MAMTRIAHSEFYQAIVKARAYVKTKYQIQPYEESFSAFEKEFGGRYVWDRGDLYFEFDDDIQATMFLLRWS